MGCPHRGLWTPAATQWPLKTRCVKEQDCICTNSPEQLNPRRWGAHGRCVGRGAAGLRSSCLVGGWEASFWGAERSDGASVVQCPVNALNAPDALLLKWFLLRQVEFTSIKKLLKMLTSPRSLGRAGLNAEVRGRAGGRCLCRLGRWLVCWREPRRAPSAARARPPRSCRPLPATPQPAASLLRLPRALVQTCPLRSGRRSLPAATGLPGAERAGTGELGLSASHGGVEDVPVCYSFPAEVLGQPVCGLSLWKEGEARICGFWNTASHAWPRS